MIIRRRFIDQSINATIKNMFKKVCSPLCSQARRCSSAELQARVDSKIKIVLDENARNLLNSGELKPRKHPGTVYRKNIELPEWVLPAIKLVIKDYPTKELLEAAQKFSRHLRGRHPPAEVGEIGAKLEEIKKKLMQEKRFAHITAENEKLEKKLDREATKRLTANVRYVSSPIEYNTYNSLLYVMARSAQDYAILYKIFKEIRMRDKDFQVKNLLDFGSGIGTVSWAATELWSETLTEHVCIDASKEISDVAEELAKHSTPKIKRVFHRQYLPVTPLPRFDLVVSAFSLFDLPDRKSRLDVILALWRKTENYLVLVEQGTYAGFKVINEARDFILHVLNSKKVENRTYGHIFSPCPHELSCPRMASKDNTPCNFIVSHTNLSLRNAKIAHHEPYCYIVFKKGPSQEPERAKWPRIVRPPLVRSRHTICRMCTSQGKLLEVVFSASKHERPLFYSARSSEWGDQLPIEIISETEK